jgi:hypothetical protein
MLKTLTGCKPQAAGLYPETSNLTRYSVVLLVFSAEGETSP